MTALHQQDNWFLNPMTDYVPGTWQSWIHHECGFIPGSKKYALVDPNNRCCPICQAPIPDEIFGIWKLHNFDMMRYWYL